MLVPIANKCEIVISFDQVYKMLSMIWVRGEMSLVLRVLDVLMQLQ